MPSTNKILGQVKPASGVDTTLYAVPALTQANVNVFICNQSAVADSVRLAVTPSGGTYPSVDSVEYLLYDAPVDGNACINVTGIALSAQDFITIYSTNGTCSFVAMGLEVS
jgi:hypothetical protein